MVDYLYVLIFRLFFVASLPIKANLYLWGKFMCVGTGLLKTFFAERFFKFYCRHCNPFDNITNLYSIVIAIALVNRGGGFSRFLNQSAKNAEICVVEIWGPCQAWGDI